MTKLVHLFMAALICGAVLMPLNSSYAAASVDAKTITIEKLNITYPYVYGLDDSAVQTKINETIQEQVQKLIDEKANLIEAVMNYTVHYSGDDILSIQLDSYYFYGGAHGMTSPVGYNFDLKTGKNIPFMALFDFRPSEINAAIFNHTSQNRIPLFDDFDGIKSYPSNYCIKAPDTAIMIFPQYAIAPYSSGIIYVEINK